MAYSKAREERKWKKWKEREERQLRIMGMDEESIQRSPLLLSAGKSAWQCF